MAEMSQTKVVLRWVGLFPGAVLGAWLAWLLAMLGNRLTFGMQGIDPDSFLSRTFIEFFSHAVMGAAFVYAGAKIAPIHQKVVAYSLAGLGLLAAGFLLFPAFMVADYWAIWGGVSLVIGVGVTAFSISKGEVDLET